LDLTESLLQWMFERELTNEARGAEAPPDPQARLVNVLK